MQRKPAYMLAGPMLQEAFSSNLTAEERAVVARAYAIIASSSNPEDYLTLEERTAMRAFLQRGETRLSTYQRVAGVFLNGAGLLVLLPAIARDTVQDVLVFGTAGGLLRTFVVVPWLVSIALPLYAIVLLLRDLVEFYFAPKFLSRDPVRITRFSLAGLTLSYDEGVEAKARVIAVQERREYADFVFGRDRQQPAASDIREAMGSIASPLRHSLMAKLREHHASPQPTPGEMMTYGLDKAGSMDTSLCEEVARMEASIARHVLHLRRLVLRYMKALILFVWTTLISFMVVSFLSNVSNVSTREKVIIALTLFLVWAATCIYLVRLPRKWIDRLATNDPSGQDPQEPSETAPDVQDEDIRMFESRVTIVLLVSCVAIAALLGATVAGA